MKKFLLLLLVVATFSVTSYSNNYYYDVNGDGAVTAADVTALYDILLNNDYSHAVNADVNADGTVTAADITKVYDMLLGYSARLSGSRWYAVESVQGYTSYPIYTTDFDYMEIQFYTNGTGTIAFYDDYGYWGSYGFSWDDHNSYVVIFYYNGGQDTYYYDFNLGYLHLSRDPYMSSYTVFTH